MNTRIARWGSVMVVGILAAHGAVAAGSSGSIACEQTKRLGASAGRYACDVTNVRRGESVLLPASAGCSTYRDFEADASSASIAGVDVVRRLPQPRFTLRRTGIYIDTSEPAALRVDAYVNRSRIRFINRSKFMVTVSFTKRCRVAAG